MSKKNKIKVLWIFPDNRTCPVLKRYKALNGLIALPCTLREAISLLRTKKTKERIELHSLLHKFKFDKHSKLNKEFLKNNKIHILENKKDACHFIKKTIEDNKIEIVHLHTNMIYVDEVIKIKEKKNISVMITLYGYEIYKLKSEFGLKGRRYWDKGYEKYFQSIANRVDLFIPLSKWQAKFLHDFKLDFKNKIKVLHNGVNTNEFYPLTNQRKSKGIVVFSYKRTIKTFEAAKTVIERMPDVLFIMLGKDTPKENKLLDNLRIRDRFKFIDFIKPEKMNEAINNADIILHPSWAEGCSNFVLEAMSCGKPIIGSKDCGIDEEMIDGKSGILINQFDSEDISKAIIKLGKSKKLRQKLGKNARKRVFTKFTDTKKSLGYLKCYESLVNQKC